MYVFGIGHVLTYFSMYYLWRNNDAPSYYNVAGSTIKTYYDTQILTFYIWTIFAIILQLVTFCLASFQNLRILMLRIWYIFKHVILWVFVCLFMIYIHCNIFYVTKIWEYKLTGPSGLETLNMQNYEDYAYYVLWTFDLISGNIHEPYMASGQEVNGVVSIISFFFLCMFFSATVVAIILGINGFMITKKRVGVMDARLKLKYIIHLIMWRRFFRRCFGVRWDYLYVALRKNRNLDEADYEYSDKKIGRGEKRMSEMEKKMDKIGNEVKEIINLLKKI